MNDENEAKNCIIDKVLGFVRQTDQHHLPKGTPLSSFYFTSEAVVCVYAFAIFLLSLLLSLNSFSFFAFSFYFTLQDLIRGQRIFNLLLVLFGRSFDTELFGYQPVGYALIQVNIVNAVYFVIISNFIEHFVFLFFFSQ